jgi:hypothetical protein
MINKLGCFLIFLFFVSCIDTKDKNKGKADIDMGVDDIHLPGTTWIFHVSNECVDTLIFKPDRKVTAYDCELNYTFNGEYSTINDTLLVSLNDDSHSEDGNKSTYLKDKYLLKGDSLSFIGALRMSNGKWREQKAINTNVVYHKTK